MISFDDPAPAPDRARHARVLDELTAAAALVPQTAGGPALDDDDFLVTDAESVEATQQLLMWEDRDAVPVQAVGP